MVQPVIATIGRRAALASAAALALAPARSRAAGQVLRIGYQKYGTLLLLRARRQLEPALRPLGWDVSWAEFTSGPQLMEALAAGAVDVGQTGEAPPVFAQAAGTGLVYLACEPPAPQGEAILVPPGSPIRDLAGLKGRTIAFNKGSNVHYLVLRALASAGLGPHDFQPAYLAPPDGRAAFERGSVDAWAIWDPFLAAAQAATGARVLADGAGLAPNRQFMIGARAFADAQPAVVHTLLQQLDASDLAAEQDRPAAAGLLAAGVGLPQPVADTCMARLGLGILRITPDVVAGQQAIADAFAEARLIPARLNVASAVWSAQT